MFGCVFTTALYQTQMALLLEHSAQIVGQLKSLGYDYVTLDLEGFRSGSMDIHIKKKY